VRQTGPVAHCVRVAEEARAGAGASVARAARKDETRGGDGDGVIWKGDFGRGEMSVLLGLWVRTWWRVIREA
jgi:hypothetical protein